MRAPVAELAIPYGTSTAADHVTLSIGVGSRVPDEELEPKQLVDAAEQALDSAKALGGNRACSER